MAGLLKLHVPCLLYDDVYAALTDAREHARNVESHQQEAACLLAIRTANSRH